MFEIYNNTHQLWQWSTGQRLIVNDGFCGEVHFSNIDSESPVIKYVYDEDDCRFVDIPDELLKTSKTLKAYAYNWGGEMLGHQVFIVYPRPMPENYTENKEAPAGRAVMFSARPETEKHIVIHEDRSVSVPEELRCIAVEHDHNIETVTFDCPRYWDGHDFFGMNFFVNYRCADGSIGQYHCDPVTIDESDEKTLHFDWVISQNLSCAKGKVSFVVCIKKADDKGVVTKRWSSRLNQEMEVFEGIECSDDEIASDPDVVEQILARLDMIENNMGGGGESIFWVTYLATTYAEIEAAYEAGRLCVLDVGGSLHLLSEKVTLSNGGEAFDFFAATYKNSMSLYRVQNNNKWETTKYNCLVDSDEKRTINENSSHEGYPTPKAVYDAIPKKTSDLINDQAEIFWAEYGVTPFAEVAAAFDAGELCLVKYINIRCCAIRSGHTTERFIEFTGTSYYNEHYMIRVMASGEWSVTTTTLIVKEHDLIAEVNAGSTSNNVPTAKAVYTAIQTYSNPAIEEALRKAKESGEFNGAKGDPGNDYILTEADKQEIAGMIPGGGGGTSVQPDWNQNDETAADYIKNRPCYKIPTYLLEETNLEFIDQDGMYMAMGEMSLPDTPEKLIVNFDGVEYPVLVDWNDDGTEGTFGNGLLFGGGDTGEPFMGMIGGGMYMLLSLTGASSAKVSIRYEFVKTLDLEYVPPESEIQMFDLVSAGLGTVQRGTLTTLSSPAYQIYSGIGKALHTKGAARFKIKITGTLYSQVESGSSGGHRYEDEEIDITMNLSRIYTGDANESYYLYSYLDGYIVYMYVSVFEISVRLLNFSDMRYS